MPRRLLLSAPLRLAAVLVVLALLAGCGSAALKSGTTATASAEASATDCPTAVMSTLAAVLRRVYREGVRSERTASAEKLIENSLPLRASIESGSAAQARAAAGELLATGHMTNLKVRVGGRTLVSVGHAALAPISGAITGAGGRPIATYMTSVWSDAGFSSEASGIAEGLVSIRSGARTVGGTLELPPGALPAHGSLTHHGVAYRYTSFPATAYPAGAVRIYLLKPQSALAPLCGAQPQDTVVNTLQRVAQLIYEGERGPRTLVQVRRVQHDRALLAAVQRRDPAATMQAVAALLHHHLVRLRVSAGGRLLADDGGPFVLAPVTAELRMGGRRIGNIVLSIQDDEGYLRLTHRLAGLDVLMYMNDAHGHPMLVKNSLGPGVGGPESVPASGPFTYRGHSFRVFTIAAAAFPTGPLTIRVLVPIPYS